MSKNRRNTMWTYLIGLIMLASGFYIMIALSVWTSGDECPPGVRQTWNWIPPEYHCGR
jgi:hypothetical protein